MTAASSISPSEISRRWHRRSVSVCLPCSLTSASSRVTVPRAFCVGVARVSASDGSVGLYATDPDAMERLAQYKWSKRAQPAPAI